MACQACENTAHNKSFLAYEKMFGLGTAFPYTECSVCGHIQIDEIPADLRPYYPDDYYSFKVPSSLVLALKRKRAAAALGRKSLLGNVLRLHYGDPPVKKWLALAEAKFSDRILDVGCGQGLTIRELGEVGFAKVCGVDPFIASDVAFGKVQIYKRSLAQLDESFDLIMMNHSFEHMIEPLKVLKDVHRVLAPGGRLLVRVPIAAHAWREYGNNWVGIDAPRHLFIPTEKSMLLLAQRAGFKLISSEYDSDSFHFWASEQYKRGITLNAPNSYETNPKASLFDSAAIKAFEKAAEDLNRKRDGDQACFVFQASEATASMH